MTPRPALLTATLAALALAGCAPAEPATTTASTSPSTSASASATPAPQTSAEQEPDLAGPKVVAYGTADQGGSWTISVDSVTPYLQDDPPTISELIEKPAGSVYVVATVTARNTSAVRQDPAELAGAFSYSGADLQAYDDEGGFGYMDGLISMANTALPGGVLTGNLLFTVPREAITPTGDVSALNAESGMLTTWSAQPNRKIPPA